MECDASHHHNEKVTTQKRTFVQTDQGFNELCALGLRHNLYPGIFDMFSWCEFCVLHSLDLDQA